MIASCDTVVVVGEGRVLFAKNSDRDPNEAQPLDWQPRREHPAGARVRCTWLEIEQAPRTHAVLLSRPFWMWGAEMGANEHGVVIGNEAVFTDQPYRTSGLTGMDLLRLALERAATAEEAVNVLTGLLERYGQGGGCGHEDRNFTYHNSFLVADRRGAYVVETAGQLWAVEHVRVGARSISNGLTIPGFAAHSDRLRTAVSACRTRRPRTEHLAAGADGPAELMAALRDHGAGRSAPRYSPLNGGMAAPCMHAGGLAANSQTTASWVADLRPDTAAHWVTGTAAPCTSLFKPVRVDQPLDLGPSPTDVFDEKSLWWRHERLHRTALRDPATTFPRFTRERDETEARWLADPPPPEEAFAEAGRLLTKWTATVSRPTDHRPLWTKRYWRIRDTRAALP
ncbi:carcinine hydrolase/isopenicillin-N N-acyltransferase family protein, partial [Amycolatopsis alkalitolerans]